MCIEFAWKRAGIPILRNFIHGTEAVLGGLPPAARKRFQIGFTVRKYQGGKYITDQSYYVSNVQQAFPNSEDAPRE